MGKAADAIFAADQPTLEKLSVPEWGRDVWVRTMSGAEKNRYEQGTMRWSEGSFTPNLENATARLVVLTACEEDGSRIFEEGDAERVGELSAGPLERIAAVAERLNGLGPAGRREAEKNSKGRGGGSSSGSRSSSAKRSASS